MKSERTITVERRGGKLYEVLPDGNTRPHKAPKSDRARLEAMTDEEVLAAARADPDAQPLTKRQLARAVRITPVKRLRIELGLSQVEFAERFQIPVGTLRDWEQHHSEPDQTALAYLKVIGADPKFVERALAKASREAFVVGGLTTEKRKLKEMLG